MLQTKKHSVVVLAMARNQNKVNRIKRPLKSHAGFVARITLTIELNALLQARPVLSVANRDILL